LGLHRPRRSARPSACLRTGLAAMSLPSLINEKQDKQGLPVGTRRLFVSRGGTMSRTRFMNVKMDADLVQKAKVVAAMKHTTLSKYLTEVVRSHVEKDMAIVALELGAPAAAGEPFSTDNDGHPRIE